MNERFGEKNSWSQIFIWIISSTRLYRRNCIGAFHFGLIDRLMNGVFNVNEPTVISQYGSTEPWKKVELWSVVMYANDTNDVVQVLYLMALNHELLGQREEDVQQLFWNHVSCL